MLIGNCGKEPEITRLQDGTALARFSLATTESYRAKDGTVHTNTEWHPVVCWRSLAELAEKYVTKGSYLMIKGKLKHRQYKHAAGHTVYVTEVVTDELLMLDKPEGKTSADLTAPPEQPGGLPF